MPATVVVAATLGGIAASAGAAIAGTTITAALFFQAAATAAIGAGLAYLTRPDEDEPDGDRGAGGRLGQTVTSPIAPARWILGRARVGGVLVYATEEEDSPSTLWMVLAIGEAPMDRIERIWVGDEEIGISRTAAGVITPVAGNRYAGNLTVWEEFGGEGATGGPGPTALRAASGGEWTTEHAGNGVAYAVVRITQPSDPLWSGIPNLNFLVRGLKITWPGQATATWTENAAALRWWFMRHRRGIPEAAFDTASVTEAVAHCGGTVQVSRPSNDYADWPATEIRYAVNGVIESGESVESVEAGMDWCWQGWAVEFDGIFHFRPGKDRNSVATITDADILALTACCPAPSLQSRLNAATMTIRQSAQHNWQGYAVPEVTDAAAAARDGVRLAKDLGSRRFVSSPSAADRIIRTFLRRAAASFRATYRLSPRDDFRWLLLKPTDTVLVTDSILGLSGWRAMVISTTMEDDWSVVVELEDCPDQTWRDTPGLGQPGRPYLRLPRRNDPPSAISGATAAVEPRVSTDGTVHWKVLVTAPASPLGFAARLDAGAVEDEKRTAGSTIEFDVDSPRAGMTVTVWRETDAGIAGAETTLSVSPEYSAISIPAPTLADWRPYAGIVRFALADPASRAVDGAEFRYRSVAADSTDTPGAITAERWLDASQLDALRVMLTPGRPAIFNVTIPETAKYRIAARFIDVVGRLGPVTDLGVFTLAVPLKPFETTLAAPAWAGTSQHLAAVDRGAERLLLPDRDEVAALPFGNWNGYAAANSADGYRYRHREDDDALAWGSRTTVAGSVTTATVSGLTNGTAYQFEVDRLDGSAASGAATVAATPTATPSAPPKPTLSVAASGLRLDLSGSVVADGGAAITRWEARWATSIAGLGSAGWATVPGASGNALSGRISNLSARTVYYVEVRAVNSAGTSPASDRAVAATGAGGGSEGGSGSVASPAAAPPPSGVAAARVGSAGARLAWTAPEAGQGLELSGFEMEFRTSPSGAWTEWPGQLPPDQTERTVPDGVGGDDAWRIRAVYAGGPTGTTRSEWVEAGIADLFSGGAGAAANADLQLTAVTGDGEVTLAWTDPNVRLGSVWPWGDCEGYNQTLSAADSTWWRGEAVDLGATKSVEVSVAVEHYEPPLSASGNSGAAGAAEESGEGGPVFRGDLLAQVWEAGAEIDPVTLPVAEAEGRTVAYRVDGLPRGVRVDDGSRRLAGTPSLAAGTRGVARIEAVTPDGLADTSFFEWTIAASAAKSGAGSPDSPYALPSTGPSAAEIRDWLRPGATNAADLAAAADGSATRAIPTHFSVTVPAGEVWRFDLWDPDGDAEDFDLVDYPEGGGDDAFHVTTGGRERHVVDNSAGSSAVTRRIGVYVHATATETASVNASVEGQPAKPKVRVAWTQAPRTGLALAEEWDGYAAAAAATLAPNSESVTDVYIHHGTTAASLARVGPITGERALTARYVQTEVHLRKWRGRALRQVTTQIRES